MIQKMQLPLKAKSTTIALLGSIALSSCTDYSAYLEKREAELDAQEQKPTPHPIGATYDLTSSKGEHKQFSVFYDGAGKARLLYPKPGTYKILLDFSRKEITTKDFEDNSQETKSLDPYEYPIIINNQQAEQEKAECAGRGQTKGFPYHRWLFKKSNDEWEVWTDDNDCFPVYYRSIKNGDVTSWTLVNAWVDGSTYNKPTFFTLEPDPPPPEPPKNEAELQKAEPVQEKSRHDHKHISNKRRPRH